MKWTHHLFSVVQFFQVLLLILGGVFCFALPFAPNLRVNIADAFLFKDTLFTCLGIIFCSVGLILGLGFYFLQRHQMLQVSMNPPASIDREVIRALVQTYLQKRFPGHKMTTHVVLGSSMELITENLKLPPEDLERHLSEMETEISQLLSRTLGYDKKFLMTFLG